MSKKWSDLPPDLLHTIAKKLTLHTDYIHFRSVCHSFHSSTPPTPTHLPTQLPFLLLPQSQTQQTPKRAFFNLSLDKVHFFSLPQASNFHRRCGSSHGWLLIAGETPELFLLNFMTRGKVGLPPLSSFPNVVMFDIYCVGREYCLRSRDGRVYRSDLRGMRDLFIKKMVLSASPSRGADFVALVILNQTGDLAFCKRGDKCWRFIEEAHSYCEDVMYHKGLFYAVNKRGAIAVCDVSGDVPSVSYIDKPEHIWGDMIYVVSSMDEILLLTRYLELEFDVDHHQLDIMYKTTDFQVFRLDLNGPKWESVTSLNDCVLFVGENSSLALSTLDFPECKGNRIFYTDDYSEWNYDGVNGDHDLGVYNLEDGSIEALPCYPKNSYSRRRWPPPIWVTPNPC